MVTTILMVNKIREEQNNEMIANMRTNGTKTNDLT
jgi:hypothetical protein